jgi:hypothetical protein
MTAKELALEKIKELVSRFEEQLPTLKNSKYKEHNLRMEYLNPFWEALGWDIHNTKGLPQSYKEVEQEDTLKIENLRGAPDYCFRKSKDKRFFYLEAKKPIENIKENNAHALQTRTYGWNGNLSISILSDFEEFGLYDCTKRPKETDTVRTARLEYMTYKDYEKNFDFLWDTFSRDAVFGGSIDQFASKKIKRGKDTVDKEFLISLDKWRTQLAENISLRNKNEIDEDQLNFSVQQIIDRLIFLRIAEDRNIEPYGNLSAQLSGDNYYRNILGVFANANNRYNSGLFDPTKDTTTTELEIDNKVIKEIVSEMYYPKSPYLFDVISVEILGSAYEQFLGKTITINNRDKAIIELKPEVRKAGGVYYTPQYIVDYIVENTVGKLLENKKPIEASELKICDPACGSGSFLLGAYQYLLNWHKDYYLANPPVSRRGAGKSPSSGGAGEVLTPEGNLTTGEKKRILLNNIYGVDIDTNAVEVTKLSLLLKCMEGETQASIAHQMTMFNERVLPTLDDNIKSGNSLIDTDFWDGQLEFEERKIKPFSWQKAFPTVFKNGGFDVVIGNPPYLGGREWKEENGNAYNYFINKYKVAEYQFDIYALFWEAGIKLLNSQGLIGYITPNTWLNNQSNTKLRIYILENTSIEKIVDYSKIKVFDQATVLPIIAILNKSNIEGAKSEIYESVDYNLIHTQSVAQSIWKDDELNIININLSSKDLELRTKIEENKTPLEELALVKFGIKLYETGKGNPIQDASFAKEKVYESDRKIDATYRPYLEGKDIHPYTILNKNRWLKYGANLAAPRSSDLFEGERILVRRIVGDTLISSYVNTDFVTSQLLQIVKPLESNLTKYILAIINSKLIAYYFRKKYNRQDKTFPEIRIYELAALPIKTIDFSNKDEVTAHDQIVSFVDQLLQLNKDLQSETLESKKEQIKRKIDHYEDKINELVYKLYDLTEEEIKIVEIGK